MQRNCIPHKKRPLPSFTDGPCFIRPRPHRLEAQDATLSRLRLEFESPWGHLKSAIPLRFVWVGMVSFSLRSYNRDSFRKDIPILYFVRMTDTHLAHHPAPTRARYPGPTASPLKSILLAFLIYAILFIAMPLVLIKGWEFVCQPAFLYPLCLAMAAFTLCFTCFFIHIHKRIEL